MPQSTTPPQPRSKLHDVLKMRALSRCWATRPSPFFDMKPSMVPSKSASDRPWCRLKCTIINVNNANKAANKYITPVTKIALICRWKTPKAPSSAALPKIIKHTSEQDIDRFCIPATETERKEREKEKLWISLPIGNEPCDCETHSVTVVATQDIQRGASRISCRRDDYIRRYHPNSWHTLWCMEIQSDPIDASRAHLNRCTMSKCRRASAPEIYSPVFRGLIRRTNREN